MTTTEENLTELLSSFRPLYRVFRNLWDSLRQLIVGLKIMKESRINICPICLCLLNIMNFVNRANSSKLVSSGMVYLVFIIIIIS